VTAYEQGNERRYYLDRAMWGQFLRFQPNGWPTYRDWPRLLGAARQLSRWLYDPALEGLSPYMLASTARMLMERLEPDLGPAGVSPAPGPALQGEGYWDTFVKTVERLLATLENGPR
jgi:hypothetical protein